MNSCKICSLEVVSLSSCYQILRESFLSCSCFLAFSSLIVLIKSYLFKELGRDSFPKSIISIVLLRIDEREGSVLKNAEYPDVLLLKSLTSSDDGTRKKKTGQSLESLTAFVESIFLK